MQIEWRGSFAIFLLCLLYGHLGQQLLIWAMATLLIGYFDQSILGFLTGFGLAMVHDHPLVSRFRSSPYSLLVSAALSGSACYFHTYYHNKQSRPWHAYPSWYSFVATLLVAAATANKWVLAFFECRVSRVLGRLSFALYLIHIHIVCSLSSFVALKLVAARWSVGAVTGITVLVSVVASFLAAAATEPIDAHSITVSRKIAAYCMDTGPMDAWRDLLQLLQWAFQRLRAYYIKLTAEEGESEEEGTATVTASKTPPAV